MSKFPQIILLLCASMLSGCGQQPEEEEEPARETATFRYEVVVSPENALPDPHIDWSPHAFSAFAEGDCSLALGIAVRGRNERELRTEFIQILEADDQCAGAFSDFEQTIITASIAIGGRFSDNSVRQRWADEIGIRTPVYRLTYSSEISEVEEILVIPLSENLTALETAWFDRCEDPMALATTRPYSLRQLLSSRQEKPAFLIPEWEERNEECEGHLLAIRSEVEALRVVNKHLEPTFQQIVFNLNSELFSATNYPF